MGFADPGALSLGQWVAIVGGWNVRNGKSDVAPPTEEEFELAVIKARGVSHGN
jgi:hypothetical protein